MTLCLQSYVLRSSYSVVISGPGGVYDKMSMRDYPKNPEDVIADRNGAVVKNVCGSWTLW